MAAMVERDYQLELMRLGNFLHRFPIGPVIGEHIEFAPAAFPARLGSESTGMRSGKPEARWDARFEDRHFDCALVGLDALQLRPMDRARRCVVAVPLMSVSMPVSVSMEMRECMAVTVAMAAMQLSPRRNRDPAAVGVQRRSGSGVDDSWPKIAPRRRPRPATRSKHDDQSRDDMPGGGLKRGRAPSRLSTMPVAGRSA